LEEAYGEAIARFYNVKERSNDIRGLRLFVMSIGEIEARFKASEVANVLIVIIRRCQLYKIVCNTVKRLLYWFFLSVALRYNLLGLA
jgi:hypothetical protein